MKNITLLKDTMEWIKSHPEQHDQGNWGFYDKEACETHMCFAGHAAILAGGTFNKDIFLEEDEWHVDAETGKHVPTEYTEEEDEDGDWWGEDLKEGITHVADFAARKLGLSEEERVYLFSGSRTQAELEEAVEKFANGYSFKWTREAGFGFFKEEN